MRPVSALLLLCTLSAISTFAEPVPALTVERTEVRRMTSKANGVAYKLYVALPHGYPAAGKRYPVVYLLDADYSFLIARNIADHLAERDHLRELILVAVAYDGPPQYRMNRTRDYTPTFSPTGGYGPEYQKVSGGGPKFRTFLEKELLPFIDRTYATLPGERCLVGHSYGGLFATWNLLTASPYFRGYIVVSPSLWYDDSLMLRMTKPASLNVRVYAASGAMENSVMARDLRALATRLRDLRGLAMQSDVLAGETHNSIFPRALSNGLRFVFEGR